MKVAGVEDLQKTLRDLGVEVERYGAAALIAGGFEVSNRAKELAPVKTGNLMRSIFPGQSGHIEQEDTKPPRQEIDVLTAQFKRDGTATMYIGTGVEYAAAQEFLPYEHKIGVSPYLRPALEDKAEAVRRTFEKAFRTMVSNVEKAGQRYGAGARLEEYAGE
jgi:hypothetical protein